MRSATLKRCSKPSAKCTNTPAHSHRANRFRLRSTGGENETLRCFVQVPAQTHDVPDEQQARTPPFTSGATWDLRGLSGLRQGVRLRLEQDAYPAAGEIRMRHVRSAASQGNRSGYRATLYARRRKGGLCVDCAQPALILDENVATIILRGGQFVVERGRLAARCRGCQERERTRVSRREPPQRNVMDR